LSAGCQNQQRRERCPDRVMNSARNHEVASSIDLAA
jgi:hypothetical protein